MAAPLSEFVPKPVLIYITAISLDCPVIIIGSQPPLLPDLPAKPPNATAGGRGWG
jgi:hypothetical protein